MFIIIELIYNSELSWSFQPSCSFPFRIQMKDFVEASWILAYTLERSEHVSLLRPRVRSADWQDRWSHRTPSTSGRLIVLVFAVSGLPHPVSLISKLALLGASGLLTLRRELSWSYCLGPASSWSGSHLDCLQSRHSFWALSAQQHFPLIFSAEDHALSPGPLLIVNVSYPLSSLRW